MSNLPVVFNSTGQANLPAEVMAGMASLFEDSFQGLGGSIRRIKCTKMGFELHNGSSKEEIPANECYGVFIGSSPCNHAVWYAKDYAPGQEPEQPDLIWNMPDQNTFPNALPQMYRQKITKNGRECWAFQIRRRLAFAMCRTVNGQTTIDFANPYIMDISSMSLFGKSLPENNMYKWGAIKDLCLQFSTPQQPIYPNMFLMQILMDPTAPVGVVMFRPMLDQNGHLRLLDPQLILASAQAAQSPSTRTLLTINEKLTFTGAPTPVAPVGQVVNPVMMGGQVTMPTPVLGAQVVTPTPVMVQPTPMMGQPTMGTVPAAPAGVQTPPWTAAPPIPTPASVSAPAPAASVTPEAFQTLLQQAQAVLNTAPAAPAMPTPVAQPTPVQPTAAPVADASVQSSINQLLAQLG